MEDVIESLREYSDELALDDRVDESLSIDEAVLKLENSLGNRQAILRGSKREPGKYPPRIVLADVVQSINATFARVDTALVKMNPPGELLTKFRRVVSGINLDVERPDDADKQRENNKKLAAEIEKAVEFITEQIAADESKKVARAAKALSSRYRKLTKNMIRAGELPVAKEVNAVMNEAARETMGPIFAYAATTQKGYFDFVKGLFEVGLVNRATVDHEAESLWVKENRKVMEDWREQCRELGYTTPDPLTKYREGYDICAAVVKHDPRNLPAVEPLPAPPIPRPTLSTFEAFSAFDLGWTIETKGNA